MDEPAEHQVPVNVRPLEYPRGGVPTAGLVETCLLWFPVMGWIVAAEIARDRLCHVRNYLERQLAARPASAWDAWACGERRTSLARFVAGLVRDEFDWPSDRFIPNDSIEMMFFDDDGGGIEIFCKVEEHLGVPQDWIETHDHDKLREMTFGSAVDWLLGLADQYHAGSSVPQ